MPWSDEPRRRSRADHALATGSAGGAQDLPPGVDVVSVTLAQRSSQIVVVDDDVTTSRLIQMVLLRAGFSATCTFSVAEALAAIRRSPPDLVLLDVNLPDGSGFDMCRQLRGEAGTSQLPIVFISSDGDVATKVRGFDAGGVDFVSKPLAGAEIVARVKTHLRLRQAHQALAALQAESIRRLAGAQQMSMPSPSDLPEARFQLSHRQLQEAGGDFYDVITVGDRVIDYVVADASGHDLAASFWTSALKALLAEYASLAASPREILQAINTVLCRILPEGVYFTLVYGRLNRGAGRLTLVNAGHPPAIAVVSRERAPLVLEQSGDVAGSFADAVFEQTEVAVAPGDRFFLYSDGLTDGDGCRSSGVARLAASCAGARALSLEEVVPRVVQELAGANAPEDDVVLMAVEV